MQLQDDRLCDACRQLNLTAIFDPLRFDSLPGPETFNSQPPERTRYLQHFGDWSSPNASVSDIKNTCAFCHLLTDILEQGPLNSTNHLQLYSFPNYLLHDLPDEVVTGTANILTSVCLLVSNSNIFDGLNTPVWRSWLKIACEHLNLGITVKTYMIPDPSMRLTPLVGNQYRHLQDESLDYELIRYWLKVCAGQHGKSCSPSNQQAASRLKLIDCQTRRIINTTPENRYAYVALSYVWGTKPPEPYIYPLLPETLPPLILDVMTLVLRLDLRYLWVDRYCIWQDDPIHKMTEVDKMDQIYSDAYFTISACAGTDPEFGIPTLTAPRARGFQFSTTIGRETLVTCSDYRKQLDQISKSIWKSRAWTFQEEILSPRRLYITEYQASFECNKMTCFEHLNFPSPFFRTDAASYQPPILTDLSVPQAIWDLIEQYSGRQITHQSDRIIAITGVLNAWCRLNPGCFQYWGIPVVATDSCWRVDPDIQAATDKLLRTTLEPEAYASYFGDSALSETHLSPIGLWSDAKHEEFFGGCILTKALLGGLYMWSEASPQVGIRNRGFPSWSWAGQGAGIQYYRKYGGSSTGLAMSTRDFDARVWVETSDGKTVEWEEFAKKNNQRISILKLTPYLHIECWAFKIGPFHQRLLRDDYGTSIMCVPVTVDLKSGSMKCIRKFKPNFIQSASSALLASKFDAIAFSPISAAEFALVLDTFNGVLERIGLLELRVYEIVDDGTKESLEWKNSISDEAISGVQRRRVRIG